MWNLRAIDTNKETKIVSAINKFIVRTTNITMNNDNLTCVLTNLKTIGNNVIENFLVAQCLQTEELELKMLVLQ